MTPSTWQLNLGIQQPSTLVKVTMINQLLKKWPLSHPELLNVDDFGSIYKPKITLDGRTPLPLCFKEKKSWNSPLKNTTFIPSHPFLSTLMYLYCHHTHSSFATSSSYTACCKQTTWCRRLMHGSINELDINELDPEYMMSGLLSVQNISERLELHNPTPLTTPLPPSF